MAPRISNNPFFQGLIRQRSRPDPVRSSILVASQVLASCGCTKALLDSLLNYEAAAVLVSGVVSTLFHACDERLVCPVAYTPGTDILWQQADTFAFFSQLATFVAVASGVSLQWQVAMRAVFFVMGLALLLLTHPYSGKRAPRKGQPEALAAAAGLLFPGCLLHLASIFIGVEDLDDNTQKFHTVARGTQPRTPHFWMFHSLWHLLLACAMFLACLYRSQRPKATARPQRATSRAANKRQGRLKWWLLVVLQNIFPSLLAKRQDKPKQPAELSAAAAAQPALADKAGEQQQHSTNGAKED